MARLEEGHVIESKEGNKITIKGYIGEGGQGEIYRVEYEGKQKALKWYKNVGTNPDALYRSLENNIKAGSPDKHFLWPQTVTKKQAGTFGYIMDLKPDGYYEIKDFMLNKVHFASYRIATETCLNIVSAFRILHNEGYSYQDLNSGNFFINPITGNVLVCDNDNVAPDGIYTGIIGTPMYMAPEIVCTMKEKDIKDRIMPSIQTDRFSLAIILFILLFMNHPLEGKNSLVACMDDDAVRSIYGTNALFIYDAKSNKNAPVANIHTNVIKRWKYMPMYIKEAFQQAFSQEVIKEPAKRLRELDWLKVLTRFRSEIATCSCGDEVFLQNTSTTKCDKCGKPSVVYHTIQLREYAVSATKGTYIYKCQLCMCNADEALSLIGVVHLKDNDPNQPWLENLTDQTWKVTTPSGNVKYPNPHDYVPIKEGIIVEVYKNKMIFK